MAFDFNKIMQKTKDMAGVVADKSKDIAKTVADKTVSTSKIAKLSAEITAEKETLKKAYIELGKYYYERVENKDPAVEEQVMAVTKSLEIIEAKRTCIDELKAAGEAAGETVEIPEEDKGE